MTSMARHSGRSSRGADRSGKSIALGIVIAGLAVAAFSGSARAQASDAGTPGTGTINSDGTVVVPSFELPPSIYLSDAAKAALPRKPTDPEEGMFRALASRQAGEFRKRMPEFMAPRLEHLAGLYPVTMRPTTIAGVAAVIATPVKPMPAALGFVAANDIAARAGKQAEPGVPRLKATA